MDYANNPNDGDVIRVGSVRKVFKNGAWLTQVQPLLALVSGGLVDFEKGDIHVMTCDGTPVTITVANTLPAGEIEEFYLECDVVNETTVTFPESFKWSGGVHPTMPLAPGRYVFGGYTRDGGTRFEMVIISNDSK